MRDFSPLRIHFRNNPDIKPEVAAFFCSPDFPEVLTTIAQDSAALARLTIDLLRHMPLDPMAGSRVEDFIPEAALDTTGQGAEEVGVYLPLDRLCNFIGPLTVQRHSPEFDALVDAVKQNLSGKRFRAARALRRMESDRGRRVGRFAKAARQARQDVQRDLERNKPELRHGTEESVAFWTNILNRANQAYDRVYDPLRERLDRRMTAVARAAVDPDVPAGYTQMLEWFAEHYIIPVYATEAATA